MGRGVYKLEERRRGERRKFKFFVFFFTRQIFVSIGHSPKGWLVSFTNRTDVRFQVANITRSFFILKKKKLKNPEHG
jgi:hypothetical protein